MYRILVTGSRRLTDAHALEAALTNTWHDVTQLGEEMLVVHGACYPQPNASGQRPYRSADWLTHLWCATRGVQDEPHPADWHTHGKAAGPIRNQAMVALGAALCIAAPLGASTGTRDCTRRARAAGIEVVEVTA
ncbi:hypothetical protein GCM10017673_40260 [Streptosporangium violaceochromogenes]|nr:hypothetical protein GCM10017673_40260 [Streptosporangium violaceochromogenes]